MKLTKMLLLSALTAVITLGCANVWAAGRSATPYDRSGAVLYDDGGLSERSAAAVGATQTEAEKKAAAEKDARAWKRIKGVSYNGSGDVIPGAVTRGIDVSSWQNGIDWFKVRNSEIDFAIVRISDGITYIDKRYKEFLSNANAVGLPVGVYVYSRATTKNAVLKEAQLLIERMQGYKISYPVVLDLECDAIGKLSGERIATLAQIFAREIRRAGYYPMAYFNANWYKNVVATDMLLGDVDIWLAWYNDKLIRPDPDQYKYTIWQCTCGDTISSLRTTKKLVDGIDATDNVDLNFGFVDYTKIITPRTKQLASYVPTPTDAKAKNGWATENGKTYYYVDGKKVTGTKKISGKTYRFATSDGHLYKSQLLYLSSAKKYIYLDADGLQVKSKWVTAGGKKYYLDASGYALTGTKKISGKYYYFDTSKAYLRTNFKHITSSGNIYYYDKNGVRYTKGFITVTESGKKNTYYFNKNGLAYKGWHTIKGKLYYFRPGKTKTSGIRVENTTMKIGGKKCVFDKNGVCTSRK